MARYVLDTNVFLICVSRKAPVHWMFERFRAKAYDLCVTTEILSEYAEVLERHMGHIVSQNILKVLENSSNLIEVEPTYRFHLLADPDDNKFVDCATAANAVCIVSHDRDFLPLQTIEFPKVAVVNTEAFREFFL